MTDVHPRPLSHHRPTIRDRWRRFWRHLWFCPKCGGCGLDVSVLVWDTRPPCQRCHGTGKRPFWHRLREAVDPRLWTPAQRSSAWLLLIVVASAVVIWLLLRTGAGRIE